MTLYESFKSYLFNLLLLSLLSTLMLSQRFSRLDIHISDVLELLPLIFVTSLPFSLPLAAAVTAGSLGSRWKAEGEVLALSSGAISINALRRPLVLFFLLIATLSLPVNHTVNPQIQEKLFTKSQSMLNHFFLARVRSGLPLVLSSTQRLFTQEVKDDCLRGLTYTQVDNDDIMVLQAEKGRLTLKGDNYYLDCQNLRIDHILKNKSVTTTLNHYELPLNLRSKSNRDIHQEMMLQSSQLTKSFTHMLEKNQRWIFSAIIPLLALGAFNITLCFGQTQNKAFDLVFSLFPVIVFILLLLFFRSLALSTERFPYLIWTLFPVFILGLYFLARFLKAKGIQ
jgi:lipopolysaccharide export LptBFGC system permease protein LptF